MSDKCFGFSRFEKIKNILELSPKKKLRPFEAENCQYQEHPARAEKNVGAALEEAVEVEAAEGVRAIEFICSA